MKIRGKHIAANVASHMLHKREHAYEQRASNADSAHRPLAYSTRVPPCGLHAGVTQQNAPETDGALKNLYFLLPKISSRIPDQGEW